MSSSATSSPVSINADNKTLFAKYISNSIKVEALKAQLSEFVKENKELQPQIIDIIKQSGQDGFSTSDGNTLMLKRRVKRGGLSKKLLETELPGILSVSDEKAKETIMAILSKRTSDEIEELKLQRNK